MKKKFLPFLLRLALISLLFVPVLSPLHEAYLFTVALVSFLEIPSGAISLTHDGFNNLYTFLVLILAIPGMSARKRIVGVGTGIAAFILADSFMTGVWLPYLKTPRPSLVNMAVSYGWLVVAHYLLPFLLWLSFAFREIEALLRQQQDSS